MNYFKFPLSPQLARLPQIIRPPGLPSVPNLEMVLQHHTSLLFIFVKSHLVPSPGLREKEVLLEPMPLTPLPDISLLAFTLAPSFPYILRYSAHILALFCPQGAFAYLRPQMWQEEKRRRL